MDAIAIDCCWLVDLDREDHEFLDRLRVITEIDRLRVRLLLDHGNSIVKEYDRNLPAGIGQRFIRTVVRSGQVAYESEQLTVVQNAALDALPFDPNDRPYLAVAARYGSAVYLTSEKKHLHTERREQVKAICGVTVVDTKTALALLTA